MLVKNLLLATTIVLLTAGAIASQTNVKPGNEVVWRPVLCGENVMPALTCQRIATDRGVFYIMSFDGVSVAMSPMPGNLYVRSLVQITNHSGRAIALDPLASMIDVHKTESDFISGNEVRRISAAITAEKAEKNYIQSLSVAIAPLPPPSIVGSPGIPTPRNSTSTVDAKRSDMSTLPPDSSIGKPPPERPNLPTATTPTVARGSARAKTLEMFDQALHVQTIVPDGKAAGYIFFEPVRERTSFIVFKIKVGDIVYVFPEETTPPAQKQ